MARHCCQNLCAVYRAQPDHGLRPVAQILDASTCPSAEVSRLDKTLRRWRVAIMAHFSVAEASSEPMEAINDAIETMRKPPAGLGESITTAHAS